MKMPRDATSPVHLLRAARWRAPWRCRPAVCLALLVACGPADASIEQRAEATATELASAPAVRQGRAIPDSTFARLSRELSEPGGYFDTDNLISNERSYLHVMEDLRDPALAGTTYLGVGPDQNFSYMAAVRPSLAFIVDIRRDNLLQHLWFKALFELAPTRVEYLSLMFGRPAPSAPDEWTGATVEELAAWVDEAPFDRASEAEVWTRIQDQAAGTGISLTADDLATIGSIFHRFAQAGLDLRFTSHYRGPRPHYPTYRHLLLEKDRSGEFASYLVDRDSYVFLRNLQLENRVIPVVGDLAGDHALRTIGEEIRARGSTVGAFYTSNVEFYLMGDGTFDAFARNVESLPMSDGSVIVRSYFDRFRPRHPEAVPGYVSVQLLHPIAEFLEVLKTGGFTGYWDLVTRSSGVPG
jgi:hypothetical protein